MSGFLWKYYLEDDVGSFRQLLETAAYTSRGGLSKQTASSATLGLSGASPASFGTSPTLTTKKRKTQEIGTPGANSGSLILTRQDLNHRDLQGRTILHLAASSANESAYDFAVALLDHPLTDLYLQDIENGWTALHRAFYAGNVAIAHAILSRDSQDAMGHGTGYLNRQAGGLIKIKDNEGNGPLDLFEGTFQDTNGTILAEHEMKTMHDQEGDADLEDSIALGDEGASFAAVKVGDAGYFGDEVYTFGSNKNITLGFGDEDDRQFPERITLKRPNQLYFHFYQQFMRTHRPSHTADVSHHAEPEDLDDLPAMIRNTPITIKKVYMAKFHTAILTTDPHSNLYICGHGSGGRLGTGDESTRFQFVCIEGGALSKKHVQSVALGQNHTLAITDAGDIFSWGNNGYGQLGYGLPRTSITEDPLQTQPRQIFGILKREVIAGVAASRLHSVAYTATSLYTFGKNEGQLGLVDSDARSLEIQDTPRKVAASLFTSSIISVSAIDRATTCLLENHEVWIFANYGYAKVQFPLDGFTNYFLQQSFRATKYETSPNTICKVVSSGDTICALSTSGDVFAVDVNQFNSGIATGSGSTTHPSKIKGALSPAQRIWSNRKIHMAAVDVDVDQNGSIILVTKTGSVWRRVKRAKIKDASAVGVGANKPRDFKFSRISGLTRVISVCASGSGAYAAIRRDSLKTREDIDIRPAQLSRDLLQLSPFEFSGNGLPEERSAVFGADRLQLSEKLGGSVKEGASIEDMIKALVLHRPRNGQPYDLLLASSQSDVKIPIHSFLLGARSNVIRAALENYVINRSSGVSDLYRVNRANDGSLEVTFENVDLLTVFYLVLYLYTESAVRYGQMPIFPIPTKNSVVLHRQSQRDLVKLASRLDMSHLSSAIERSLNVRTLDRDMDLAIEDPQFFATADLVVVLADGEMPVHGALVCQRCPFFGGLFGGRAGGKWLAERRMESSKQADAIRIDLEHVQSRVFSKILRYLYADVGPELFDEVVAGSLDDFLDEVIEVMGVANELMLDRLCDVCQYVIGRYVTTRNVCQLLNAVALCSVDTFKRRALEYICLNLEAVLQNGVLNELDEELLLELDEVCQQMQMDCSLVARSGVLEAGLLERHPGLEKRLELQRQSKIDSIVLLNKYAESDGRVSSSFRAGSFHELSEAPVSHGQMHRRSSRDAVPRSSPVPIASPMLREQRSLTDLMFSMDHEGDEVSTGNLETPTLNSRPETPGKAKASGLSLPTHLSRTPSQAAPLLLRSANLADPLHESTSPRTPDPPQRVPDKPWGASPLPSEKLDLRTILAQAAGPRASQLTNALAGPAVRSEPRSTAAVPVKVSQKERKRQQQAQLASTSLSPSSAKIEATNSPNPWQTISLKPKPLSPVNISTSISQTMPRPPQLTMRQTIANPSILSASEQSKGAPVSANLDINVAKAAQNTSTPSKKVSRQGHTGKSPTSRTPEAGPSTSAPSTPGFAINVLPPKVQSVRHTPLPQRPSALSGLFSMNDILADQQAEKDGVKEAANAKRSMADIQAEQQFQEWWDKEAQRVQMEEEERLRRSSLSKQATDRGSGSGKSRRRKHLNKPVANATNHLDQTAPSKSSFPKPPRPRRTDEHHHQNQRTPHHDSGSVQEEQQRRSRKPNPSRASDGAQRKTTIEQ